VEGRVQGVGFRYFVLRAADRLQLKGWVRNLPDGTVEVHAEGESAKIQELRERLGKGPTAGYVTEVHENEASVTGYENFKIRF